MRVIVVAVSDDSAEWEADAGERVARSVAEIITASTSARSARREGDAPVEGNGHRLARLTPREIEVLRLMSKGLANADIARRLFISEKTAKAHVSHIFEKLEVGTRVQAVIAAKDALDADEIP
jgi:DNA-binding NarL/FixJ family response regulator